jgi:hypothetical protein
MFARYYGSSLPRFLSVDPIDETPAAPQTWNRYTYVDNNPLVFIDPTGMYGINPNPHNPKGTNPCDGMGPRCKEKEPTDEDREDYRPMEGTGTEIDDPTDSSDPMWAIAYNCISATFHAGNGDPDDDPENEGYPPQWDNTWHDELDGKTVLSPDEPNQLSDIVVYGHDRTGDGLLNDAKHFGRVTAIDGDGNAIEILSKVGDGPMVQHHPAARLIEAPYGSVRVYLRE